MAVGGDRKLLEEAEEVRGVAVSVASRSWWGCGLAAGEGLRLVAGGRRVEEEEEEEEEGVGDERMFG